MEDQVGEVRCPMVEQWLLDIIVVKTSNGSDLPEKVAFSDLTNASPNSPLYQRGRLSGAAAVKRTKNRAYSHVRGAEEV